MIFRRKRKMSASIVEPWPTLRSTTFVVSRHLKIKIVHQWFALCFHIHSACSDSARRRKRFESGCQFALCLYSYFVDPNVEPYLTSGWLETCPLTINYSRTDFNVGNQTKLTISELIIRWDRNSDSLQQLTFAKDNGERSTCLTPNVALSVVLLSLR